MLSRRSRYPFDTYSFMTCWACCCLQTIAKNALAQEAHSKPVYVISHIVLASCIRCWEMDIYAHFVISVSFPLIKLIWLLTRLRQKVFFLHLGFTWRFHFRCAKSGPSRCLCLLTSTFASRRMLLRLPQSPQPSLLTSFVLPSGVEPDYMYWRYSASFRVVPARLGVYVPQDTGAVRGLSKGRKSRQPLSQDLKSLKLPTTS